VPTELILSLAATGAVSFVLSHVGAAAGLVLGHLRLPLLVFVLGSPVAGSSANLAVSGAGALAGAAAHLRGGRVCWKVLLLMGLPSAGGAVLGVLFLTSLNPVWAHLAIGGMMVYAGVGMVRSARAAPEGSAQSPPLRRPWAGVREVVAGLGLGMLASATGLMLGTLRLPMLIRWLRVEPAVAIGTNMLIGCVTAAAAAAAAWGAGAGLHPLSVLIVGPPTVLGSYLGSRRTARVSPQELKRLVGWVVAASGAFMLVVTVSGVVLRLCPPAHRDRVPPAGDPAGAAPFRPDAGPGDIPSAVATNPTEPGAKSECAARSPDDGGIEARSAPPAP
jgi:uncharacterized membrane protein YfcA